MAYLCNLRVYNWRIGCVIIVAEITIIVAIENCRRTLGTHNHPIRARSYRHCILAHLNPAPMSEGIEDLCRV